MNRLYALESMPAATGSRADHRLPIRPSEIEAMVRAIAAASGVRSAAGAAPTVGPAQQKWAEAVAKDLLAHRGSSLVVAGDGQPPAVHALAHAMNAALGNVGRTVVYTDPVEAEPVDQVQSLRDLVADMTAGKVDTLVIVGGNPVYTAPADITFAESLGRVPLRVHLSLYDDETSALCHWQIPEAHFLEAWSDARGYDGTVSIVQPLIAPLYNGKSAHELLAAMSDRPERSGYDIVREYWSRGGSLGSADTVRLDADRTGRGPEPPIVRRARRRPDRHRDGDHSGVRDRMAPLAARRRGARNGIPGQDRHRQAGSGEPEPCATAEAASRSSSGTTPPFSTAGSPTTAGCRSCPSRSPG